MCLSANFHSFTGERKMSQNADENDKTYEDNKGMRTYLDICVSMVAKSTVM